MIGFEQKLKENNELSKTFTEIPYFMKNIESCNINNYKEADKRLNIEKNEVIKMKCNNEELAGKYHPVTGVYFERKIVDDGEGNKIEGVFPQFDYEFEATLDKKDIKATDSIQFDKANKQLKEAVESNPDLAKKFTPEQLEMIKVGKKPRGYTWHHSEETGKLQLVDSKIHSKTSHTGGKKIWGGGSDNR